MSNLLKITSVAVATLALPTLASAQTYSQYSGGTYSSTGAHQQCLNGEAKRKIVGSVIGGAAGSFIGKKLAADNTKTEGAVLGGLIGGSAGYGIGDKTIDCDPVYETQPAPVQTYQTTQPTYVQPTTSYTTSSSYPSSTYSSSSYSNPGYSSGGTYHQTGYSTSTSYPSRVTVSNHPVYSNPSYGASTATSYNTAPSPSYYNSQPRYVSTTSYARPARTVTRSYRPARRHYHGKHVCSGAH